jgi:hypothetical protein
MTVTANTARKTIRGSIMVAQADNIHAVRQGGEPNERLLQNLEYAEAALFWFKSQGKSALKAAVKEGFEPRFLDADGTEVEPQE